MSDETSPSGFARLDELRDRQQLAWQRGERLLVEALVAGVAPALGEGEWLELIYAEVRLRAERGESFPVDEYTSRFPQFALFLRRLFASRDEVASREGEAPAEPRKSSGIDRQTDSAGVSPSQVRPERPQTNKSQAADRNLLFGILALQMDFIDRDGLVDALRDWTTQKDKPLGQILVERGGLSVPRRELLEPLVEEHVQQHDQDPAASLASISSITEGTIDWHRVHDVDIAESLAIRRLARNAAGASDTSRPASERTATGADRFRVLRPHAKGGIGEVFLAFDEELHREVALKEIQSRHLRDEANRERFVREAEVTGGLEHPGIVPVYSLGHHSDGRPFYAMRFIRGDSLKEAIERFHAKPKSATTEPAPDDVNSPTVIKPADWTPSSDQNAAPPSPKSHVTREQFESVEFRKLLGRFIDVCQAIEYAHSRGVLHRDLKPGNIMLGKYGETLVVDWGLAKIAGKEDRFANVDEATLVPSSGSSVDQTADGSVIGTPAYMSPEQAAGKLDQLGPATDVYSLGATLYHILTGRSQFEKLSLSELLFRVQKGDFPHPRTLNRHIPRPLEAICLKAVALRPSDRYTSVLQIAEDLEHWMAHEPVSAFREPLWSRFSRWRRKHPAAIYVGGLMLLLSSSQFIYDMESRRRQSVENSMRQTINQLNKRQNVLAQIADAELRSDWNEAVTLMRQIEMRSGNPAERRLLARGLYHTMDYKGAAEVLRLDYRRHAHGAWENFLLAASLASAGDHQAALEYLNKVAPEGHQRQPALDEEAVQFKQAAQSALNSKAE